MGPLVVRVPTFAVSALLSLLVSVGCGDDDTPVPSEDTGVVDSGSSVDSGSGSDAGDDAGPSDVGVDAADADEPPRTIGGERPTTVRVPTDYDPEVETPLVILLHGYGASGAIQDAYFGATRTAREEGFLLLRPDGLTNAAGSQYWNATDACCDFAGTMPDDVGYLRGLIAEMKEHYNVGPVYLIGHSNGGFMSYRMACDAADDITAIVSIAGSTWQDAANCTPSRPVSILQIHGTLDATIAYRGSTTGGQRYPSAETSVERFAERAGCTLAGFDETGRLDLESSLPGDETEVRAYDCPDGLDHELWTIRAGGHIPAFSREFFATTFRFMQRQGVE